MDERHYRQKTKLLWALILIAGVYSLWFNQRQRFTGNPVGDGTISVLLGLFICSRPAGPPSTCFSSNARPCAGSFPSG
jgi:hypothetical protein